MPISDPEAYMRAADSFLAGVEQSRLTSARELEAVRADLSEQIKAEARRTAEDMGTVRVGGVRVLAPDSANLNRIGLRSERVKQRFSDFRLSYLDPTQAQQLPGNMSAVPGDQRKFIRHSRRLARHAREFLGRLEELEPSLEEEIQETLLQIADNDMDLLKLEIRSFTRMKETLTRAVQGRKQRGEVLNEVNTFDLNRNLWNLSLLQHPAAAVRGMLGRASERMAERVTTTESDLPKRATLLVAVPPEAQKAMAPSGRTAQIAWRTFTAEELDKRRQNTPGQQQSPTSWRGLGLGFNTAEWYLPVPPEIALGVQALAAERRAAMTEAFRRAEQREAGAAAGE